MSKKSVRILAFVFSVLLVIGMLCACSSSDGGSYNTERSYDSYEYSDEGYAAYDEDSGGASSSGSTGADTAQDITNTNRKIIEKYTYSLETKTYDTFISDLEAQINTLGGYIASLDSSQTSSSSYIHSSYTVKIPSEKKDEFRTFISENANIISSSIDTEDVTLQYIDVDARLNSLRLEQESLETLLKNANSVSDIIDLQERLSEVIYEIEYYESQKRALSAEVDYTTFYLTVKEVEHETVKEEESVWQRIGSNLEVNFAGFGEFFKELFIGIISLLPLWIVLGVNGLIVFFIVKFSRKAAKKKREAREKDMKEHPEKYAPKAPYYPQYAAKTYPQQMYTRPPVAAVAQTAEHKPVDETSEVKEETAEKESNEQENDKKPENEEKTSEE